MFKPVAMIHMSVVVLARDERTVLRQLGQAGVIQLTRTAAGPETAPLPPRERSADLARLDRLATRLGSLRQALALPPHGDAPIELAEISLDQAEEDLRSMEEQSGVPLKRRHQLLERAGGLTVLCEQVSGFGGLEIPLDQPDESSFLHFVTGTLPADGFEKLEVGDNVALLPLPEQNGRQVLVAMTTRQGWPTLDQALQRAGFQPASLPFTPGANTKTLTEQNQREREQITSELEQVNAVLQKLAEEFAPALARMDRLVDTERRLLEAEQNFPRTETAVLLTGWMPGDASLDWEPRLRKITQERCVITSTAPGKLDPKQIPILLRHPRWLRPFEMLVTAYGLPQYRELEPTLFVAASYLLMFGMMFGDIGHGALLALGGLAALLAGRTAQIRQVGLLLLFGGGSSMIFGALYGSCFGLESFKKFALWHDPLAGNPMNLMAGAIGIGMVMISLGLILNIINRFRRGDILGGLLDKYGVAGAVFYWGALVLATQFAAVSARGLTVLFVVLFLALPVVGWTLKEPLELFRRRRASPPAEPGEGMVAAFSESLVGAFEAVLSYFSNTISFVRLAAYAMSHAALLLAAFLMADAVKHLPVAGGVLSVLVIILGNAVALALEGIVASVQALRLEYYEFFSKFFPGSGQPFIPFCLPTQTVADPPP